MLFIMISFAKIDFTTVAPEGHKPHEIAQMLQRPRRIPVKWPYIKKLSQYHNTCTSK